MISFLNRLSSPNCDWSCGGSVADSSALNRDLLCYLLCKKKTIQKVSAHILIMCMVFLVCVCVCVCVCVIAA